MWPAGGSPGSRRARIRRALRGIGFVAVGVAILLDRDSAAALLLTALAIYLIYEGASALLRLVYRAEDHRAPARGRAQARHFGLRGVATVAIPAVLIVAATAAFLGSGGTTTAAPPEGPCNGHDELCDRPLDRVALAATHNSMSVPLPGWFSSLQERPIADQLRDGVRGLLIDTHYADKLPNGNVRTLPRRLRGAESQGRGRRREPRRDRGGDAHPGPPGLRGRGRARDVPVPLVLRAGGDRARAGAGGSAELPGGEPGRASWS